MTALFKKRLQKVDPALARFDSLQTLQVNLGNRCNLSCSHCHVKASPRGRRIMPKQVIDRILVLLAERPGVVLDLTGGSPEMHPLFRYLVESTDELCNRRIVRSNLTVMTEAGMEWLADFYASHGLTVSASLPCYLPENVDGQRGSGVYERSILALKMLNRVGYGERLELNLVYNPGGPFVPGSQKELESAYREQLLQRHNIRFSNLHTITNAPIGRFREYLESRGGYGRYIDLLAGRFNPAAAGRIMCRTLVSVDWKGLLYNCDFNQACGIPITDDNGRVMKIGELAEAAAAGKPLSLAQHCYCCTAGEGSSCTGALI